MSPTPEPMSDVLLGMTNDFLADGLTGLAAKTAAVSAFVAELEAKVEALEAAASVPPPEPIGYFVGNAEAHGWPLERAQRRAVELDGLWPDDAPHIVLAVYPVLDLFDEGGDDE